MPLLDPAVYHSLSPRPRVRSWEWICASVQSPDGTVFDGDNVPWCRGVCEAYDDPRYREIDLMWASRMAKTLIGLALQLFVAANDPKPMLFGEPTEKLVKRIITQKLWPMIRRCEILRDQIGDENALVIELRDCRIQAAWSGSETQLADYSAAFSHAGEVDKWSTSASTEGDTLEQFLARSAEYTDRKNLIESTPGEKATSRIEPRLKAGTNSRFHVPCLHCHTHQKIFRGDPAAPERGGMIWDLDSAGHTDPDRAYRTARYRCPHCGGTWDDEHRAKIIRAGVWVPEGQHADSRGRLQGTAKRPDTRVWSSQLSQYYSLQRTWGDLAEHYAKSWPKAARRKAFIQLIDGETWSYVEAKTEPEMLGQRIGTDLPLGLVPEHGRMLTLTFDVQKDCFPFTVISYGKARKHLVDYGRVGTWAEVEALLDAEYQHADGGPPMRPHLAMLDSGHRTLEVYRFCRRHSSRARRVLACKGSDSVAGRYVEVIIGEGKSRARRRASKLAKGQRIIHVAIDAWENEIQQVLDELGPEDPGALTLCAEAAGDIELCKELLNGTMTEVIDKHGGSRMLWVKKDPDFPNDIRDCFRYSLAGHAFYLDKRRGLLPPRLKQDPSEPKPPPAKKPPPQPHPLDPFLNRPGGLF